MKLLALGTATQQREGLSTGTFSEAGGEKGDRLLDGRGGVGGGDVAVYWKTSKHGNLLYGVAWGKYLQGDLQHV